MNQIIRKLLFFFIIQVFYYNFLYIIFIPEIYTVLLYIIALILYYVISLLDTLLRPLQDEERDPQSDKFTIILIILFLANPFFLIASVVESNYVIEPYVSIWNQELVSMVGILIFGLSGFIMILGRVQLGKYATGKLSIQQDHELVDKGLYKYIRHPIYAGSLIGGIGYFIAFNSIVIMIVYTIILIFIFNQRLVMKRRY